ncbi:class I SAM-dependent methyltransferase [Sporosarcina sp. BI001-red]|uniref:class I SAM-dependent methyltransferase n=1 Tax=Sporosarcina sp. BI001-red TaxID=2282866 RepID=UPI000E22C85B|nr:class I SAM-dependent methyltransferase [Sporosarcina sp. BI001-red]REB06545.1 class I SAM-dependent methyltransferase [Sporosarcina sp. BI001-red]
MKTNTEQIFSYLDEAASKDEALYLEQLIEACQSWREGTAGPEIQGEVTKEEIRRGLQLAILKGMRQNVQPHHQMTPDAIGMLIARISSFLLPQKEEVQLLDLAAGTGNLLLTVMNSVDIPVSSIAVEIDELLARLIVAGANLMEQPIQIYVQDALRPLLVDPVDLAVCDLPVGFYPDDENALNYEMMPSEGHAYSHHLFIEQTIQHLKPEGYGIFIVPSSLFESVQSSELHKYLKKHTVIRGILQLPQTLFKNASQSKSLLILQKPSERAMPTPDVLLATVPDMTDKQAMISFFNKMEDWAKENVK